MSDSPLVFALLLSPDGIIRDASDAFFGWANVLPEQVLGRNIADVKRLPSCDLLAKVDTPVAAGTSYDTVCRGTDFRIEIQSGKTDIILTAVNISEEKRLSQYVNKYISKDIGDLSEDERSTFAIPERRYMSVSFTDLRGFTAMSEKMKPEEVRETINAYLEAVMKAVEENKGTIDKIVGDEVMALYGAPRHYKDHALRAVKTALDQVKNLRALQEEYRKQGKVMPSCGIGVNTGEMVVGNIGSEARMNYTVLGSSVNLAARLCGAAQGGQVICTQATLKEILDALPDGWKKSEENPQPQPFPLNEGEGSAPPFPSETCAIGAAGGKAATGGKVAGGLGVPLTGKTEGVFELPEELRGVVVSIGPEDAPVYQFRYLYSVKVKGVDEPLPVIEAVSVADEARMKFSAKDILSNRKMDAGAEKVFGKYRLIERIGKGGMAEVWKARDMFGNDVAVKMLLAGESATAEQAIRFMRESEVMKSLDHPGICRIIEFGQYENISFIAMEYVNGASLGEILSSGVLRQGSGTSADTVAGLVESVVVGKHSPLPPTPSPLSQGSERGEGEQKHSIPITHALKIFTDVLDAVQYAHEHGIIHRDLKPGNIMLRRSGDAVVMDFGLARFGMNEGDITQSTDVVGTIDFMAPEQAEASKKADERSDIFSLGAVL